MKSIIARLSRTFGLSSVRALSLFRSCLFFFAFVAGVTTFKSGTNALFLARRDPTDLPYLYLATALVITVVTIWIGRNLSRLPAKPVLKVALMVAAIGLMLLTGLAVADAPGSLGLLYVSGEVYATSISVLFWARLGEVFDVRTAKRVFGAIGASGMAGAVLGGLAVRLLSDVVPAEAWCAFAVITLFAIRPLLGKGGARGAITRTKTSLREGLAYLAVDSFPRGVGVLVLLLAVQSATVDYVFRMGAVSFEGTNESALVGLFGVLNALVGVGAIAFQLMITAPLLRRLGVFIFLSIIPIVSLFMAGWSFLTPTLFIPLFLLKSFEMMGSLSLYQPGLQLLYNPMPTGMRNAVRALVDGAIKKLGGAVGGILLIFFGGFLQQREVIGLVVVLAGLLLLWIRTLRGSYLRTLSEKLGGKGSRANAHIDLADAVTRNKVLLTLYDSDPGKVLAALSLLIRDPTLFDLKPHIETLISHSAESVRLKTIELITTAPDPSYAPILESVIADDTRRSRSQAARALHLVDREAARRVLRPILEAPKGTHDLGLRSAAIEVLLRAAGPDSERRLAEGALDELFIDSRRGPPGHRREVARLLGHLGPGPYAIKLSVYLNDPEPSVREAAVESAAQVRDPSLAPTLIARLEDRTIRRPLQEALAAYGDGIVELLRMHLDDRRLPVNLRVHIPPALRLIGSADAVNSMLFSNVQDDAFLRYVIVRALARTRRERPDVAFEQKRVHEAALRRLRAYTHYRPIAADLSAGGSRYGLLLRAVEDRVRQNLEAALTLLGLAHDMAKLTNAIHGFRRGAHADAVELVDLCLQGTDVRTKVLQHLEQSDPSSAPERARTRAFSLVEGRDIQIAMIAWETLQRIGEDPPDVREPTLGEPLMPKSIVDRVFILEGVQLFQGLSVDDLAAVAAITTEGHAPGGHVIYREGAAGDSMYVIVSGEVRLIHGGEPLMDLYAGDSFGQVSILDRGARPVTAQAGDEGVDYLNLERVPFLDLLADRPQVINGLFHVLARRLRELLDLTNRPDRHQPRTGSETIPPRASRPNMPAR